MKGLLTVGQDRSTFDTSVISKRLPYCVQMKRDGAAAFVETIKGPQWGGEESTVAVNLDPGMLAAMQRAALISPAWLAACSATMGSSLTGMAVLAANNITMQVICYNELGHGHMLML